MYCSHCKKEVEPIIENNNCHKVMCGDSTKAEDFDKLMNKKIADMCWVDPPYGVNWKPPFLKCTEHKNFGVMINDNLKGKQFYKFLENSFKNLYKSTKEGAAMYCCYASINHIIFEQAMNSVGWIVKQQLIWEKGHVFGRSDYHWSHEPILYCKRGDTNTIWYGDRTKTTIVMNKSVEQLNNLTKDKLIEIINKIREDSDVLHIQKDSITEYLHSTQKPVELSRLMIKNSSRPKEIVLVPFCGSGATLIACQSSGRICYAMEISPRYVDVILTRWAQFTNKDPIRESDKKKWSEIQKEKIKEV